MRIINIGSLNIDYVYRVDNFVKPGETIQSISLQKFAGGKGNNQSIALGRARAEVYHAGLIGEDGEWMKAILSDAGVNTSLIKKTDSPTGSAIIQVNNKGENCIIIHGGANRMFDKKSIDTILSEINSGDMVLLQNEINNIEYIINAAAEKNAEIAFNPAPFTADVMKYSLDKVKWIFANEIEGAELTGIKGINNPGIDEIQKIGDAFLSKFPESKLVLTLGSRGVCFYDKKQIIKIDAYKVNAVDTTAAGDTFIGYFLAGTASGADIASSLELGCRAAAISVTRPGAANSIPRLEEITQF